MLDEFGRGRGRGHGRGHQAVAVLVVVASAVLVEGAPGGDAARALTATAYPPLDRARDRLKPATPTATSTTTESVRC